MDGADQPVGYVLGVADTASFEERCEAEWWPPLRVRHPLDAFADGTPDAGMVRLIHEPPRARAEILADHPAHLHVDLLPSAQGGGNGRRLLETLFAALRDRGVDGVHLGVSARNPHAIGFYRHLGFTALEDDDGGAVLGLRLSGT